MPFVIKYVHGGYFKGNKGYCKVVRDLDDATKFSTRAKAESLLADYKAGGYPIANWVIQEVQQCH